MPRNKKTPTKKLDFTFGHQRIRIILDKVLIFRFFRQLHGRFWGLATILIMTTGIGVCFLIRPDLRQASTALSEFGNDVRTAPYFAGTMFFAAYGLWRWRNYLSRTLKRSRPIIGLITLTILGLYLVALMPLGWQSLPYRIHLFGVALAGGSMAATVVVDSILTKTRRSRFSAQWRLLRAMAFFSILAGGWVTFGSNKHIRWYSLSLIGELLMLNGYAMWVYLKTSQGDGNRSKISRALKSFILVD